MGRPRKDTTIRRQIIINALLKGAPLPYACDIAKVSRESVRVWARDDKNFLEELRAAKASKVLECSENVAKNDPKFWLKNQAGDEYQDGIDIRSTETRKLVISLTGEDNAPSGVYGAQVPKQIVDSSGKPS